METFRSDMKSMNRRRFLKNSLLCATAASLPGQQHSAAQTVDGRIPGAGSSKDLGIIDTNVNLFAWPFRALKYRDTRALVAKLKRHRIIEAWASSFEALLSKDIAGVHARL